MELKSLEEQAKNKDIKRWLTLMSQLLFNQLTSDCGFGIVNSIWKIA